MADLIKPRMAYFTKDETALIDKGSEKIRQFLQTLLRALKGKPEDEFEFKRHLYIQSGPGIGKTFMLTQLTKANPDLPVLLLSGAGSASGFVTMMAEAAYAHIDKTIKYREGKQPRPRPIEPFTVWFDDSDRLFKTFEGVQVLKGATDRTINKIVWQKNYTTIINQALKAKLFWEELDEDGDSRVQTTEDLQAYQDALNRYHALKEFQKGPGIEIPTNTIRFIVTSNVRLPEPVWIREHAGTTKVKELDIQLSTLHDRFDVRDFTLSYEETWGWNASILLHNTKLIDNNEKELSLTHRECSILLKWFKKQICRPEQGIPLLASTSFREVLEVAAIMKNYPKDYLKFWNERLKRI